MKYVKRSLEEKILKKLKYHPILILTGPRQSGKSTLLKHVFPEFEYISFDNLTLRMSANNDPKLFLKKYQNNVIFDEAQKAPNIFHEVKFTVDEDRNKKFILSGSSNFLLMSQVTESLAGRTSICELLPFSASEILQISRKKTFLESLGSIEKIEELTTLNKTNVNFNQIINLILEGGFPEVTLSKNVEKKLSWFQEYQLSVIEKDFRDFIKVKNIQDFNKLYRMLAFQTGNLVNYANLSLNLGVSALTVKEYINLLCTSYQFYTLQPYFKNLKTRLIKSPKIYSYDTGLSNYLERITDKDKLLNGGKFGNIFENWIINELIKQKNLLVTPPEICFFRTSSGVEVDVVVDFTNKIIPIEIKSSASLNNHSAKNIHLFIEHHKGTKTKIPFGIVIYFGDEILYLAENIIAIPIQYIL